MKELTPFRFDGFDKVYRYKRHVTKEFMKQMNKPSLEALFAANSIMKCARSNNLTIDQVAHWIDSAFAKKLAAAAKMAGTLEDIATGQYSRCADVALAEDALRKWKEGNE